MKLKTGEWIVLAGGAIIMAFAVLSGVIIYVKPPPVEYTYLENEQSILGEAIYRSQGCGACHEIFGNGPSFGPKLDGVGSKRTKMWLQAYLLKPRSGVSEKVYRLKMLPVTGLNQHDLSVLVDYLSALKKVKTEVISSHGKGFETGDSSKESAELVVFSKFEN